MEARDIKWLAGFGLMILVMAFVLSFLDKIFTEKMNHNLSGQVGLSGVVQKW